MAESSNEQPTRGPGGRFLPGVRQPGSQPWEPGQSGNPGGRPAKGPLTQAMLQALDEQPEMVQALVRTAFKHALQGKFAFFKEILDRIEGKVLDQLKVEASGFLGLSQVEQDRRDLFLKLLPEMWKVPPIPGVGPPDPPPAAKTLPEPEPPTE